MRQPWLQYGADGKRKEKRTKQDNRRLKRKVRNSYVISTVSIALVLFLLGSVGYLILNALSATDRMKESMAVYVMLEDDTGSMELLAFSRTLAESGPYLAENLPVLAEGRISVRDEKAPQLMCDRVRPLGDPEREPSPLDQQVRRQRLYLRIPGVDDPRWAKIKLILTMFPGEESLKVRCADTGKLLGTVCQVHPALVDELRELLGEENVVVK